MLGGFTAWVMLLARIGFDAQASLLAQLLGRLLAGVRDDRVACDCHGKILEHLEHYVLAEVYAASRVPTLITCL